MQVIVDYFQLSQMKSCRKEPQRSRNYLLQQRTNSFNKIQNSFLRTLRGWVSYLVVSCLVVSVALECRANSLLGILQFTYYTHLSHCTQPYKN